MSEKRKQDKEKLRLWQDRMARNESAYEDQVARMDEREELYAGTRKLRPIVKGERTVQTAHVRNLVAEIIESEVSSSIPQPKVTARRQQDEAKAKLIEDMLRNELDRIPMEQINDMMERTVPIQGGAAFLLEWDNTQRTHYTIGELAVSAIHPKQIVPQDGVYSGIEDMDYIMLKVPQTKGYIKARYGVDVEDESESDPEIKGAGAAGTAEDMVTQCIAYYRNDNGGIGLFSWVNDTIVEDLEDYQARRLKRCANCGATEPAEGTAPLPGPVPDLLGGMGAAGLPGAMRMTMSGAGATAPEEGNQNKGKHVCPYCGGTKWEDSQEEYEEIYEPIMLTGGAMLAAPHQELRDTGEVDEMGVPVMAVELVPERIPYYKPDIYPVILQKNVSRYGMFLGDSDVDKIADQQNTANRIETKIIDKLLKSGSYITLPDEASIRVDTEDMKVIRPGNAATQAMIHVYDLQGDVQQDMAYLAQVYEEARQIIGITDSFQGRRDPTSTSGKAKEFAAAQSAGRLESKRVMKDAAYAALFEAMFKFKLAYTDEPRPVISSDDHGNPQYEEFNRYDFLEKDDAGEWAWNDQFLFSCDTSAPLASNREAMWQETRLNLQSGAFGDPTQINTLLLFWSKMEMLHYPGASETKSYLEEELQRQQQEQMMQMQMQQQQQMMAQRQAQARQQMPRQAPQGGEIPPEMMQAIDQQARQDAARDAGRMR